MLPRLVLRSALLTVLTSCAPSLDFSPPNEAGASGRYDVDTSVDGAADCTGTPRRVVDSAGFPEMTLSFPQVDIDEQVALDNSVCIQDAIPRGLESLLTDSSDVESPLSLLVDLINDESAARAALGDFLNRTSTHLALVPLVWKRQPGLYPPERGDSVQKNWVLFMSVGDLSDHLFWVIVPRNGGPVTNYGFN